ncbi:MAG: type I restriction enzyme HsdR N-terminal domain-containing protein [Flavobacteriales bacterium]
MQGSNPKDHTPGSIPEGEELFDPVRRKKVRATPEERVRQEFIRYLHEAKGHPYGLMEVEKGFQLHKVHKRCDILTRDPELNPFMIVECKAPDIPIDQGVFDQIVRYNIAFKVPYLVVTNGREHYACHVGRSEQELRFLTEIPKFRER